MRRRRFLSILAGAALTAGRAPAAEWQGRALGAEARILIRGTAAPQALLDRTRAEIDRIEAIFSLHRPSELTRLNQRGHAAMSPDMRDALTLARHVHDATDGAFDPGVQPIWQALAAGVAPPSPLPFAGLDVDGDRARLAPGQALTLNGIAQGIATDRIVGILADAGLGAVLVDMGETRALDGDFALELADPAAGILGRVTLRRGRAIATSSPGALVFPSGEGHIFGVRGQRPQWSTVSVEASSAALADAASTAFVLMDRNAIHRSALRLRLGPVRLVDFDGGLTTLG